MFRLSFSVACLTVFLLCSNSRFSCALPVSIISASSTACCQFAFLNRPALSHFGLLRLSPTRHHLTLFHSILLILAGDIELNPGPIQFSLCSLNIRSVLCHQHSVFLSDFVVCHHPDLVCLTETWIQPDTSPSHLIDITPSGYSLSSFPTSVSHTKTNHNLGGGTAFLIKEPCTILSTTSPIYSSFEASSVTLKLPSAKLTVYNIYRRPSSSTYSPPLSTFFDEFQSFLSSAATTPHELLITGDFNFHLDDPSDPSVTHFLSMLSAFNLTQHVSSPTHNLNHILDLIITTTDTSLHPSINIHPISPSDHFPIICLLSISPPPPPPPQLHTFRRFKDIDIYSFTSDISSSLLLTDPPRSLGSLLIAYDYTLRLLLDKHAPLITKLFPHGFRPAKRWFTSDLRSLRSLKRKAEHAWNRTRSSEALSLFKSLSNKYYKLIAYAKRSFYANLINSSRNPRTLWSTVNSLLHRSRPNFLPSSFSNSSSLADAFASFFSDKIHKLRLAFSVNSSANPHYPDPPSTPPSYTDFPPASEQEIYKLIMASSDKYCDLDPIPTWLLKKCISVLLPTITKIVNMSLSSGTFPSDFKHSLINPLIKKPHLDKESLSNYRPISNLSFLSKLTERIVKSRLSDHLTSNSLLNPLQSAYVKNHSTETVLVSLFDSLVNAIGRKQISSLCLLDLSAAFDTIDHSILLHRLSIWFGITGPALKWFKSYLSSRNFSVRCRGFYSKSKDSFFGVPQGSVLGPLLFILYTTPLSHLISSLSLKHHLYADDTQLFCSFFPHDFNTCISDLKLYLHKISDWMAANLLTLNPNKTEFLLIGLPVQLAKIKNPTLSVSTDSVIPAASSAHNLGFILDKHLTLSDQISSLTRSCFQHIRDLRRIRSSINHKTAATIATSLVHSKLDYCNSLYYRLSLSQLNRLQLIQNALARAVVQAPKFSHVSPILSSLHWLKIPQRIEYKIASITFRTLQSSKPVYLRNLLNIQPPGRTRSSDHLTLLRPSICSSLKVTDRSFSHAAVTVWNSLPSQLRAFSTHSPASPVTCTTSLLSISSASFHSKLKTFLFLKSFPP